MTYWVKRIVVKSGEIVTERELRADENLFEDPAPVVGETDGQLSRPSIRGTSCLGNWSGENEKNEKTDPDAIVPLRVEEI
jgi:hypothetical protein